MTSAFTTKQPSVVHSIFTLLGLAVWISFGLFYLQAGLHGVLLLGVVWVVFNCLPLGCRLEDIREAMRMGMDRAMPAMFIFLMIGVVIATFILSGTVGTLVYYGLKFMHPAIFLPAGLILCSLMSLAVGTSWGNGWNGWNRSNWNWWRHGYAIAISGRHDCLGR